MLKASEQRIFMLVLQIVEICSAKADVTRHNFRRQFSSQRLSICDASIKILGSDVLRTLGLIGELKACITRQ